MEKIIPIPISIPINGNNTAAGGGGARDNKGWELLNDNCHFQFYYQCSTTISTTARVLHVPLPHYHYTGLTDQSDASDRNNVVAVDDIFILIWSNVSSSLWCIRLIVNYITVHITPHIWSKFNGVRPYRPQTISATKHDHFGHNRTGHKPRLSQVRGVFSNPAFSCLTFSASPMNALFNGL